MTEALFPMVAVPGRACGACTMCCKVMRIEELKKEAGVWCPHVVQGRGCGIYAERPKSCRKFNCGYLTLAGLTDAWHPIRSKLVLVFQGGGLMIVVDQSRPDVWRAAPFYAQIKAWSKEFLRDKKHILVRIGVRNIAVLPDEDVDLGVVGPEDKILVETAAGPVGPLYRVRVERKAGAEASP